MAINILHKKIFPSQLGRRSAPLQTITEGLPYFRPFPGKVTICSNKSFSQETSWNLCNQGDSHICGTTFCGNSLESAPISHHLIFQLSSDQPNLRNSTLPFLTSLITENLGPHFFFSFFQISLKHS